MVLKETWEFFTTKALLPTLFSSLPGVTSNPPKWATQTPWLQWILFVVATAILIRILRQTSSQGVELAGYRDPPAERDSVERLRELLTPCSPAFKYAYEYFSFELGPTEDECQSYLYGVLDSAVNKPFQATYRDLVTALRKTELPTEQEFEQILDLFSDTSGWYHSMLDWIVKLGDLRWGREEFVAQEGYAGLYQRHQKYVDEMLRAQQRQDIGRVAQRVKRFDKTLPEPKSA